MTHPIPFSMSRENGTRSAADHDCLPYNEKGRCLRPFSLYGSMVVRVVFSRLQCNVVTCGRNAYLFGPRL
jgi:hypothetical protein